MNKFIVIFGLILTSIPSHAAVFSDRQPRHFRIQKISNCNSGYEEYYSFKVLYQGKWTKLFSGCVRLETLEEIEFLFMQAKQTDDSYIEVDTVSFKESLRNTSDPVNFKGIRIIKDGRVISSFSQENTINYDAAIDELTAQIRELKQRLNELEEKAE